MKNSFVSAKKIQRDMIIEKYFDKKSKLDLNTGDVVKLGIKIDEGKNERIQYYEGLIIKGKNSGISETITVRRIVQGIGTERVVPLNSPNLVSIEQKRSSIVRRSKLYYMRKLTGKATRLKQRF
jgi:large subunit ribosomal protein L19|tara:strand:- start:19 stop:390 length:372 start_codon:yes stop_codon:yes gene_type:complete